MAEARKLAIAQLRDIVSDPSELSKGTRVFDEGGLAHLARFENKLFADAKGSGAAPYKAQIVFNDDGTLRGRCSCMAARSRPFCKHSAALLVGWARAPESFAEAAAAPGGVAGGEAAKRKEVKKGKVDTKDLMARGVEQVLTLVRELAVAGVASMAADRVEQVHALGEALREQKLRRVSARTLELARSLRDAGTRSEAFDTSDYAELMADLLLTARKLEKHIGGEALADEHVEELIGKTWTKKDRKPTSGHDLVEYAFVSRVTPDDFVIRESRFVDLESGVHYSEKQILPGFLAKRTDPKKSHAGRVLGKASGSLYPTFEPKRIDIDEVADARAVDPAIDLARLLDRALPNVTAALAALQERKKDVFAPDTLPVAIRVDSVLAHGARLRVVDAAGGALFLPDDEMVEEALGAILRGTRLEVLIGDVALDGALPTLFPLAAVVHDGRELALEPLNATDAAAVLASRKVRAEAALAARNAAGARSRWSEVARAVGASTAAIALGEIREEMAQGLAMGLPSVGARFAEPLVSRLRELGLAKQADLLAAVGERQDPAEKLDDFVKLHQVLGIALARLAGAVHVDRDTLEPVPTFESVHVRKAERLLTPAEVTKARLTRYEAAVHYARHYEAMPLEELTQSIYPTWADGSASDYVARAFAKAPEQGIAAARKVLGFEGEPQRDKHHWYWYRRANARVAKLTAIRVLQAIGSPEAKDLLAKCIERREVDAALAAHARRALRQISGAPADAALEKEQGELVARVLNAPVKEDRMAALRALADRGMVEAIRVMRASFVGDVSSDVREAAAYALAKLGDVDSVDAFVRLLRLRSTDNARAKVGAYALGILGDARGIGELLEAYAEGWQPGILAESMRAVGAAALEPLVTLVEERPEIAERKAALSVLATIPADDVIDLLLSKIEALASTSSDQFCARAMLYLTLASAHDDAPRVLAKRIAELRPSMLDKKKATTEEKSLARKCGRYLEKA
ncbi:MAG: HEAT repeat domain-containing protein [Deltaproteobacteria bacterium]|nr:HEAT repeat domain-containing protein [Deltaproteobacteria bacterium]